MSLDAYKEECMTKLASSVISSPIYWTSQLMDGGDSLAHSQSRQCSHKWTNISLLQRGPGNEGPVTRVTEERTLYRKGIY